MALGKHGQTRKDRGIVSLLFGLCLLFYGLTVIWHEPPPFWALIVFRYVPLALGLVLTGLGIFLMAKRSQKSTPESQEDVLPP